MSRPDNAKPATHALDDFFSTTRTPEDEQKDLQAWMDSLTEMMLNDLPPFEAPGWPPESPQPESPARK